MNKILSLTIFVVLSAAGANAAWADGPFPVNMTNGTYGPLGSVTPNGNTGEFEIYQAIDQLLGTTAYTSDASVDSLEVTGNTSTWQVTSSNGGYAAIGLGAAASNSLDVYTGTPGTLISTLGVGFSGNGPLGHGTSTSAYPGVGSVLPVGTTFGFAIHSVYTPNETWYSNPAYNSDDIDHMLVYNLSALDGKTIWVAAPGGGKPYQVTLEDPYLLAFEDLPEAGPNANSDDDYNDLMVLVDGVAPVSTSPVPEPMTLALFSLGLIVMAGFYIRRKVVLIG